MGDRLGYLRQALEELSANGINILRVSSIYETEPVGYRHQAWFLNLVVEAETALFPMQLLNRIHQIERRLKRNKTIVNGPRTIDIDIVFYGNAVIQTRALQIPHPRYRKRAFVLAPLSELKPTGGLPFRRPRVYRIEYGQGIC
jgi:2-amino-4-hydroxy-6-hydroxymethyldihydropteridine diphosphokinase